MTEHNHFLAKVLTALSIKPKDVGYDDVNAFNREMGLALLGFFFLMQHKEEHHRRNLIVKEASLSITSLLHCPRSHTAHMALLSRGIPTIGIGIVAEALQFLLPAVMWETLLLTRLHNSCVK